MAFTEQDMRRQAETFAAFKDELSRLENEERAMRKALGMPERNAEPFDMNDVPPELREQMKAAEDEARRAGAARAAQAADSTRASHFGGAGRRDAVRV